MGLDVYTGSAWVDADDVRVSNGSTWVQAKKVKASNGSSWILAWVPRVPSVVISFSKTGVEPGEKFDVTVTYAAGYPEGTTVHITTNTGHNQTVAAVEGATTVKTGLVSHGSSGSPVWSAVATNLGGVSATATKTQTVTVPTVNHFHEVVPTGSSAAAIQAAMNRARDWFLANKNAPVNFDDENTFACVELVANGSYNLGGTELYARRGVRLVGGGSGASRPLVTAKGTHFMKCDQNGGGSYGNPDYDWLVHNLEIDCFNTAGGFSIVHTKRFHVTDCYFHNMGALKHYIEINSSGGARADGTFNVRVAGCEFTNSVVIEGRRTRDECIQLDYSWDGAASNTANDGTVTNNVLIESNDFHDCPRAVGSHRYNGETGNGDPKGMHSNVLVRNNTFTNVDPTQYGSPSDTNGKGSEGAMRAYMWSNVQILNNTFTDCFQPICLYIPADAIGNADPTYYRIAGNYIRNVLQNRPGIYGTSGHATRKHQQILVENNIADGTWDTSPDVYFVGFDDTRGKLSGTNYGVIIRNNQFKPTNMSAAEEKAYNKYQGANATNETGVQCVDNTVSDGTEDNS